MLKVGSDFSGVGAFNQALTRLGVEYQEVFACDMDKYARQTFIHNYGEPKYYPTNVYDREIPSESLDIYMTSPPCQAFSVAGKRLGKDDKRGILFFNSYEFIQKNNPRFFIFENVKGLLSDDGGNTFQEWINMLGGRSVNGLPILFPYDNALPYHLYWQVLNAKHHGVPQNRERVFLIGIRDDKDNNFRFPAEEHLSKRLKDVLEEKVDDKYFLSEKMMELITYGKVGNYEIANINKGGQKGSVQSENGKAIGCLSATDYKLPKLIQVKSAAENNSIKIGTWRTHKDGQGFREIEDGNCPTIPARAREDGSGQPVIQTLDTGCNQGIIIHNIPKIVKIRKNSIDILDLQNCLKEHKNKSIKQISIELNVPKTEVDHWFRTDKYFGIPNEEIWFNLKKCLNINTNEFDLFITEFIEQEGVFEKSNRVYDELGIAPTMTATSADERILNNYKIRRLTPRECFRLMDFPDTFTWTVSDSQAYKQAGNSIVVRVLEKIIKNLLQI